MLREQIPDAIPKFKNSFVNLTTAIESEGSRFPSDLLKKSLGWNKHWIFAPAHRRIQRVFGTGQPVWDPRFAPHINGKLKWLIWMNFPPSQLIYHYLIL